MLDTFLRVRFGQSQDATTLARLHREAWQLAYRGIIPDPQLRVSLSNHDAAWWGRRLHSNAGWLLVLEAGDQVAGYCTFGRARSGSPVKGEIFELYLDPAHQGLGLGTHLFEAARAKLDQAGLDGLIVWVLTANEPAKQFYRRRGGRRAGSGMERFGQVELHKTAFIWR